MCFRVCKGDDDKTESYGKRQINLDVDIVPASYYGAAQFIVGYILVRMNVTVIALTRRSQQPPPKSDPYEKSIMISINVRDISC